METERLLHPRHQTGRDEPAGTTGSEAATETSQGDRDMSGESDHDHDPHVD